MRGAIVINKFWSHFVLLGPPHVLVSSDYTDNICFICVMRPLGITALHRAGKRRRNQVNEIKSPRLCFTLDLWDLGGAWMWAEHKFWRSGGTLRFHRQCFVKTEVCCSCKRHDTPTSDPPTTMKWMRLQQSVFFSVFLPPAGVNIVQQKGRHILQWFNAPPTPLKSRNKQSFTVRGLHWRDHQPQKALYQHWGTSAGHSGPDDHNSHAGHVSQPWHFYWNCRLLGLNYC